MRRPQHWRYFFDDTARALQVNEDRQEGIFFLGEMLPPGMPRSEGSIDADEGDFGRAVGVARPIGWESGAVVQVVLDGPEELDVNLSSSLSMETRWVPGSGCHMGGVEDRAWVFPVSAAPYSLPSGSPGHGRRR